MTYSINTAEFSQKIGNLKRATVFMRDMVQDALIASVYLHLKDNSGGTSPMQQVLDAVGNAAHRQGISTWLETFAPVRFVGGKILLHKENWKMLDRDVILEDFDAYIETMGADKDGFKWYQIAKEHNKTESIYNAENRVNALLKGLESHGYGALARYLSEAVDKYNSAQDLANAALAKAAAEKGTPAEKDTPVETLEAEVTL